MVANGPEDPALVNFKFYYKELLQSWRSQLKLMGHKIRHSLAGYIFISHYAQQIEEGWEKITK
jgi:hypothetical protein